MRRSYDLDANAWVRRAADTLSADVEPGALAPAKGLWSSSPPKPNGSRRIRILAVTLLALLGLAASTQTNISILLRFGLMITVVMVILLVTVVANGDHATEKDLQLLEDEDDPNVCLVEIAMESDKRLVGKDRGVVWFSDGRLFYNGHRTSFVIGGQDVLQGKEISGMSIMLRHPDSEAVLKIEPLTIPGKATGTPAEMRFRKRFYEFQRQPTYVNAPRQWPPLES